MRIVLALAVVAAVLSACSSKPADSAPTGDPLFLQKLPSAGIAIASEVPQFQPIAHNTCAAMTSLTGSYAARAAVVADVLVDAKKLGHADALTFTDIATQAYCPGVEPAIDPTPMPDRLTTVQTAKTRREAACVTIKALTPGVLESESAVRILADPNATSEQRSGAMKTMLDQEATDPRIGSKTPYECVGPVFERFVAEQILDLHAS